MGCCQNLIFCHKFSNLSSGFFFFYLLMVLSSTQFSFKVECRASLKSSNFSQKVEEDKALLRAQIGSRPPKCERRCSTCGHCEAIQVPTNPQVKNGKNKNSSTTISNTAYARRDDDGSNYKPMSWKCKCGKYIFDP